MARRRAAPKRKARKPKSIRTVGRKGAAKKRAKAAPKKRSAKPARAARLDDSANAKLGPLAGVRVVELGQFVAGPAAACVLSDWGADVVKVETPRGGDPARGLAALGLSAKDINFGMENFNRGKRSVALDLQKPAGRAALLRILESADVLVTNWRPDALERARLDYASLAPGFPHLVYAQVNGYGPRGPMRDTAAFDFAAYWARSGAQMSLGEPNEPPPAQRPAMGDAQVGFGLAGAICAALLQRERTGRGEHIHTSLYQAGMWMMSFDLSAALIHGGGYRRTGRNVPNPIWNSYRSQDGRWFELVMLQADRYWARFCRAIDKPEWERDPRWASMAPRTQNAAALIAELDALFASRKFDELRAAFEREELIWAPIQTIRESAADPLAREVGVFARVAHRSGRDIEIVRSPVEFSGKPHEVHAAAPELGEHTEEVLLEHRFTWDEISKLRQRGAFE
jgi:crotonobetainyl-CoA:carnitine CoA-transferase CaiB-like acyl-CoA transferase